MAKDGKLIHVGIFNERFNEILNLNISAIDIYRSSGLITHMVKRSHFDCIDYIDYIPDIIENPDYIGVNPNENVGESIELIKVFDNNVQIGIKLDKNKGYLYVSTMHTVNDSKIKNRLHSGRLKIFKKELKDIDN